MRFNRVLLILLGLTILLVGCSGPGASVSVKDEVNATIDKYLHGYMAGDVHLLRDVFASQVVLTTQNELGESVAATVNRSTVLNQIEEHWDLFDILRAEVTGRRVQVSGGSATVKGYMLEEFQGKYSGSKYRTTVTVEFTLTKQRDAWVISGMNVSDETTIDM